MAKKVHSQVRKRAMDVYQVENGQSAHKYKEMIIWHTL